jgi:ribosomal protein L40E
MPSSPNASDVLDYFGDREICSQCGATISDYADKCSALLDVRCEGFETYEDYLQMVAIHLKGRP